MRRLRRVPCQLYPRCRRWCSRGRRSGRRFPSRRGRSADDRQAAWSVPMLQLVAGADAALLGQAAWRAVVRVSLSATARAKPWPESSHGSSKCLPSSLGCIWRCGFAVGCGPTRRREKRSLAIFSQESVALASDRLCERISNRCGAIASMIWMPHPVGPMTLPRFLPRRTNASAEASSTASLAPANSRGVRQQRSTGAPCCAACMRPLRGTFAVWRALRRRGA